MGFEAKGLLAAYTLATLPLLVLALDILIGRTANLAAGISLQLLVFILAAGQVPSMPLPLAVLLGYLAALVAASPSLAVSPSRPLLSAAVWLVLLLIAEKALSVVAPSGIGLGGSLRRFSPTSLSGLALSTLVLAFVCHWRFVHSRAALRIEAASWGPQWFSRAMGSILPLRLSGLATATAFSSAASLFQLASTPIVTADAPWLALSFEALLLYFLARKICEGWRLVGSLYSAALVGFGLTYSLMREWVVPKLLASLVEIRADRAAALTAALMGVAAGAAAFWDRQPREGRSQLPRLLASLRLVPMPPSWLVLRDVCLPYGPSSPFSAELRPGVVHLIRGHNGAGKSTLLRCASGHLRLAGGTVALRTAQRIDSLSWGLRAVKVPGPAFLLLQESKLVPPLPCSLLANVVPGSDPQIHSTLTPTKLSRGGARIEELNFLFEHSDRPRVLLLDEPCAGLAAATATAVMERLKLLAGSGVVVVATEHEHTQGSSAAGSGEGTEEWLLDDKGLHGKLDLAGYIHTPEAAVGPPRRLDVPQSTPRAWIEVKDASVRYEAAKVVLSIPHFRADAGGIVVVRGPNGSGKSCLLASLAGFRAQISGTVAMGPVSWSKEMPGWQRRRAGLYFLPSNLDAYVPGISVDEHLRLAGVPHRHAELLAAAKVSPRDDPRELSGGQRRWLGLVLATGFARSRSGAILLLDECFSGLEAALVKEALTLLASLHGTLVVIVDHEHQLDDAHMSIDTWETRFADDGTSTLVRVA